MPDSQVMETSVAAPPPMDSAAVDTSTAAVEQAQAPQDAEAASDALFSEFQKSVAEPPDANADEPEVPAAETENTEDESLAAVSKDTATSDDPFQEFEEKPLLTKEQIDADPLFKRVPTKVKETLNGYLDKVDELQSQLAAKPTMPEHIAPIMQALEDIVDPDYATPEDWTRMRSNAETTFKSMTETNLPVAVQMALVAADLAFEANPMLLDTKLQEIKGVTEAEVDEYLAWKKSGVFDPEEARTVFKEQQQGTNPMLMDKVTRLEQRAQQAETRLSQVLDGSKREKQAQLEANLKQHDAELESSVMKLQIDPILSKVWDGVGGLPKLAAAYVREVIRDAPQRVTMRNLAAKGQTGSEDYKTAERELNNLARARSVAVLKELNQGLSARGKPAPSKKATTAAGETVIPPVAKAGKPPNQMSGDEAADAYYQQYLAQTGQVRL